MATAFGSFPAAIFEDQRSNIYDSLQICWRKPRQKGRKTIDEVQVGEGVAVVDTHLEREEVAVAQEDVRVVDEDGVERVGEVEVVEEDLGEVVAMVLVLVLAEEEGVDEGEVEKAKIVIARLFRKVIITTFLIALMQ